MEEQNTVPAGLKVCFHAKNLHIEKVFTAVEEFVYTSRREPFLARITWYEKPQVERGFPMWKQDYESEVINTQFGETKE